MEDWDEIRTAFQVAKHGTVSGAAETLGVHHATVIRHVDALEKRLGVKLFQRHARGYTPTEAGRDLLSVAQATEEQFSHLASRIKGAGETVSGELVVTSITGIEDMLTPVFASYADAYPSVKMRFLSDLRVFRLDFGEAHVAIRAGTAPQEPDYVVQPLLTIQVGLYAARSYVEKHGLPASEEAFPGHRFIGSETPENRSPFHLWLRSAVPDAAIIYRVTEAAAYREALKAGVGIGFCSTHFAKQNPELVEVLPSRPEWESPLWIVTHVDLHRTLKVQSFLAHLKRAAADWAVTCN